MGTLEDHENILEFLAELNDSDAEFEAHLKELGGVAYMTPDEAIVAIEEFYGDTYG